VSGGNDEACPRDLPEQGVQPMITVQTSGHVGEPRVDEEHPTDPADQ
jgi:hypothetical protein